MLEKWARYDGLPRLLRRMPLSFGYRVAGMMWRYDRRRNGAVGEAVKAGMRRALGEGAGDEAALERHLDGYFGMLAREYVDTVNLPRFDSSNIGRVVALHGLEHLRAAHAEGKGVILAMAHFGRPPALSAAVGIAGVPHGMLTVGIDTTGDSMNRFEGHFLLKKTRDLAAVAGGVRVSADELRPLVQGLRDGGVFIIMLDAYIASQKKRVEMPFLGGRLAVANGIERLAARTGARIVYGVARERGRRVEAELRALAGEPEVAFRQAVAEFERDVVDAPWQWWQWHILDAIWHPG